MNVRNLTRGRVIGDDVRVAERFFPRMRGLLRTDGLAEGEGIWIHPCSSIHSIGMRFEFDAIFLGSGGKVIGKYERFRRNRISKVFWNARGVLELPAGTIERTGTEVGDEIQFET